jgi:dipeptidyl aminopeptidase/acylaminoacyl peptidase
MKRKQMKLLMQCMILIGSMLLKPWTLAQDKETQNFTKKEVTIWSDGTRMYGDLYTPKNLAKEKRLPAVVFVNGTGGTKGKLPTRIAPSFVEKGFVFLAFDYRGWGKSESKLLMTDKMPPVNKTGLVDVKAHPIRWQMDFPDQVMDIRCAISFLEGEDSVDSGRIGLYGTSYGGGLVIWTAAHEPRVRCVVSQVPGMGVFKYRDTWIRKAHQQMIRQARGETEPVPYKDGAPGGKMSPYSHMRHNHAKNIGYNPIDAADRLKVPTLIIDAEKEELMDIRENGGKVAKILQFRGVKTEYKVLKGISHYGVYREKFGECMNLATNWFASNM